jgi:hypothetical protein
MCAMRDSAGDGGARRSGIIASCGGVSRVTKKVRRFRTEKTRYLAGCETHGPRVERVRGHGSRVTDDLRSIFGPVVRA